MSDADAPKKAPFGFTSTTVPPGAGSSATAPLSTPAASASRRTASNVSVPELTLTTDVESLGAGLGLGLASDLSTSPAPAVAGPGSPALARHQSTRSTHSRNASTHSRTPSITMSPSTSSVPQLYTPPPSSPSSVSRRHLTKIQDPAFWSALHTFLEQHLLPDDKEKEKDTLVSPVSSAQTQAPGHAPSASVPPVVSTAGLGHGRSPSLSRGSLSHSRTTSLSLRPPGEAEVQRLWEDFFVSQKRHLTSSEVARVRDQTGFFGM